MLIKKLEDYGIQGNVVRWTAEWLEDRKQCVQLNGQRLEVVYHKVLFLDHLILQSIHDRDAKVLCEIFKFADDTKIASQVNTLNNLRSMQRTLDKLVARADRWDMGFNVE